MSNIQKTMDYYKRNGMKETYYAIKERMLARKDKPSCPKDVTEDILEQQSKREWERELLFSILVPTFETKDMFLREMIESVLNQSYQKFELILGDASASDVVKDVVAQYKDARIKYERIPENKGISHNTNVILEKAMGDYIGLLDHDDLLTKDALYEMALAIENARTQGVSLKILYSNEDKCDENAQNFFDYHEKKDCDLELLLTNNYICHFLVLEQTLMKKLRFRAEYDGAQDFDLVLRATKEVRENRKEMKHIAKNLYHWRCHENSTAANTKSKLYAYEAGKRAVEDFIKSQQWEGEIAHSKHLGFYEVDYVPNFFSQREDVGIVGGSLIEKDNTIYCGNYTKSGQPLYYKLPEKFSGYMNRAVLRQEADIVDARCMQVNPKLIAQLLAVVNGKFTICSNGRVQVCEELPETEIFNVSKMICEYVKKQGYLVLWEPKWKEKGEKNGSNTYHS